MFDIGDEVRTMKGTMTGVIIPLENTQQSVAGNNLRKVLWYHLVFKPRPYERWSFIHYKYLVLIEKGDSHEETGQNTSG